MKGNLEKNSFFETKAKEKIKKEEKVPGMKQKRKYESLPTETLLMKMITGVRKSRRGRPNKVSPLCFLLNTQNSNKKFHIDESNIKENKQKNLIKMSDEEDTIKLKEKINKKQNKQQTTNELQGFPYWSVSDLPTSTTLGNIFDLKPPHNFPFFPHDPQFHSQTTCSLGNQPSPLFSFSPLTEHLSYGKQNYIHDKVNTNLNPQGIPAKPSSSLFHSQIYSQNFFYLNNENNLLEYFDSVNNNNNKNKNELKPHSENKQNDLFFPFMKFFPHQKVEEEALDLRIKSPSLSYTFPDFPVSSHSYLMPIDLRTKKNQ